MRFSFGIAWFQKLASQVQQFCIDPDASMTPIIDNFYAFSAVTVDEPFLVRSSRKGIL